MGDKEAEYAEVRVMLADAREQVASIYRGIEETKQKLRSI